jgi:hypothetical protein
MLLNESAFMPFAAAGRSLLDAVMLRFEFVFFFFSFFCCELAA